MNRGARRCCLRCWLARWLRRWLPWLIQPQSSQRFTEFGLTVEQMRRCRSWHEECKLVCFPSAGWTRSVRWGYGVDSLVKNAEGSEEEGKILRLKVPQPRSVTSPSFGTPQDRYGTRLCRFPGATSLVAWLVYEVWVFKVQSWDTCDTRDDAAALSTWIYNQFAVQKH